MQVLTILRQKWRHAGQNKPFWVHALLVVITLVAAVVAHGPVMFGWAVDFPLRVWGMMLQLIGAYIVWVDLTSTAKDFGAEASHPKTWDWIKGFVRTPRVILVGANLTGTYSISGGFARGRPAINPQVAVEKRLVILEAYVTAIDVELDGVNQRMGKQNSELTDEIATQAAGLKQAIGSIEKQLKDAFIGNYTIMRMGVIWLFVGIVLSSVAAELTSLIQKVPGFL